MLRLIGRRFVALALLSVGFGLVLGPLPTERLDYDAEGSVRTEVRGLEPVARGVGAAMVLGGAFLLPPLYGRKRRPGTIAIAKPGDAVLWDGIVVVIGAILGFGAVDLVLVGAFGVEEATEPFYQWMGVYALTVLLGVMAIWTTATASQRLRIDADGVECDGILGRGFLSWDGLRDVHVTTYHGLKGGDGRYAPREVARTLVLDGPGGAIRVMEPPRRSTKRRIVRQMLAHAPGELRALIEDGARGW